MIEAISAIFLGDDKTFLLLKRADNRTWNPGRWDLMGGDIQEGEDPEQVLRRDAREKLGVEVLITQNLGEIVIPAEDGDVKRYIFKCVGDYSQLKCDPKKYSAYGWFYRDRMPSVGFVPGVPEVLRRLQIVST